MAVFAGTPTEEQIPPGFPWCLVGIGTGTPDESHPELIEQQFNVITGVDVAGDPLGEFSIIGGSVAEFGKSVGRGIGEITERVRFAVQNLTGADGAKIMVSATAIDTPTPLGRGRHLVIDEHTLTAICTSQLHYASPQHFAHNGTGFTWEGTHVSDRYDFYQYEIMEKTGETTPSTGPSDGVSIYTGTAATFTPFAVSNTPYSYTVFAEYSSRAGTAATAQEGNSDAEVGSYISVS